MDLEDFSKKLVEVFYPFVELALFDSTGNPTATFNDFSHLKEDQILYKYNAIATEVLGSGRIVKCLIYPFNNGFLRLRFDLTHFKKMQDQLEVLFPKIKEEAGGWKESIDRIIAQFLTENRTQAITAKQKREVIAKLQQKGLLDFKESSAYVATKLQISRATVYNYLKTSEHLKNVHIHQVDAFTEEKFGGNPAGVVLDAESLDESTMRKIARELNLSETAFVMPSKKGSFKIRYFTPTGHEVKFCGHSSVGALYMIAKEKRFGIRSYGSYPFIVETLCGILKMEVSVDENDEIKLAYEVPEIQLENPAISHDEVAKAAGIDLQLIDTSYPVMFEATNKDLFIVIRSLESLRNVECDPKSFAQFSKHHDIVALCAFTKEAFEPKNQFHMRCFAPLVGITEDPFTGSVLGGLTAFVHAFGMLPQRASDFRVEQGHFLNRPGVVDVNFSKKQGRYHAKVHAQAVHCFSTQINLN